MTIRQFRPRTNLLIDRDPWLRIDQLHASYPFLQSAAPTLRRRIYRLRDLGHFPQHDGRAGRLLLRRQSQLKPGSPMDESIGSLQKRNSTNPCRKPSAS